MKKRHDIWAIIAAKDEAKHISEVVKSTKGYVDTVLVVDDGSKDMTAQLAKDAGARVLSHLINLGKGAAIKTGCDFALQEGAKTMILLDADGQHEPKDIPLFLDKLKDVDIVFGIRSSNKNMPSVLRFGNWVINTMNTLLFKIRIDDTQCGFRAFKAEVYPKIRWSSSGYSMESEMIANVGKHTLKYSKVKIKTIYADKYKGTTVLDGIKIVLNMVWWRMTK